MTTFKKVEKVITFNIPVGCWLVSFMPVHYGDNDEGKDPDGIVEVDAEVRQLTEEDTAYHNRNVDDNACQVQYSDTHDFRERLFTKESDAREHAEWTVSRFKNPQPWESFIQL